MKRSTWYRGLLGSASLIALATFPSRASAEVAAAFDLDYAAPINLDGVSAGYGFGIRLGSQMRVPPLLVVTPELGFTFHSFSGEPKVYRGIGGLRLGVGDIIRPGIFGHLGYGWRKIDIAGQSDTSSSFTYDFGAFVDFTLLPLLNVGVHGAYTQWTGGGQPSVQFATVGVHAALVF